MIAGWRLELTVGEGGKRKRRDQYATVPGRRTRKQIGVERRAETERVGRTKRIAGRLEKPGSRKVAEMLAEDALNGEMTALLLLLRLSG